jgi:hypothetical protein
MSEMQARLGPLNGFDRKAKKYQSQGKAKTPPFRDGVYGLDMSASENALVGRALDSPERLKGLSAASSKELLLSPDCDVLPQ